MPDTSLPQELIEARKTIDNIDAALIHILAERFRCTQKVGLIKAVHELPPADPARWLQSLVWILILLRNS